MHLTVAIATWNRSALLNRMLGYVALLHRPADCTVEVFVCDNNSSDTTKEVVQRLAAQWPKDMSLQYLFETKQGKSYALNQIVKRSSGSWLLFLDDDVRVDKNWLSAMVEGIKRYPQAVMLGGPIEAWVEGKLSRRNAQLLQWYPAVWGLQKVESDVPMSDPSTVAYGANLAVRRDALGDEPFNVAKGMMGKKRVAGEDTYLQLTLLRQGRIGYMLAGAKVGHYIAAKDLGLWRFCNWYKGCGRGWAVTRGEAPKPGKFGVAWWAWRALGKRCGKALCLLGKGKEFYDALAKACLYYGGHF